MRASGTATSTAITTVASQKRRPCYGGAGGSDIVTLDHEKRTSGPTIPAIAPARAQRRAALARRSAVTTFLVEHPTGRIGDESMVTKCAHAGDGSADAGRGARRRHHE